MVWAFSVLSIASILTAIEITWPAGVRRKVLLNSTKYIQALHNTRSLGGTRTRPLTITFCISEAALLTDHCPLPAARCPLPIAPHRRPSRNPSRRLARRDQHLQTTTFDTVIFSLACRLAHRFLTQPFVICATSTPACQLQLNGHAGDLDGLMSP